VREGPFAPFAAPAVQAPSLVAAHAPAIGAKGLFILHRFVGPAAALLPALGNVGSDLLFGQLRQQSTHRSTTDPDSVLYRKAHGQARKLCFGTQVLMENRHELCAAITVHNPITQDEPTVVLAGSETEIEESVITTMCCCCVFPRES
jgi:hypothetical protein